MNIVTDLILNTPVGTGGASKLLKLLIAGRRVVVVIPRYLALIYERQAHDGGFIVFSFHEAASESRGDILEKISVVPRNAVLFISRRHNQGWRVPADLIIFIEESIVPTRSTYIQLRARVPEGTPAVFLNCTFSSLAPTIQGEVIHERHELTSGHSE